MSKQLDIFFEAYRENFYKGHKEMWAKKLEEKKKNQFTEISININHKK